MHNISPKVAASTIGSALALIALWVASLFGVEPPVVVQAAVVVVITFALGYLRVDPKRTVRR